MVWIGKEGLTAAVMQAIAEAHAHAELIKVKILEPEDHDRKAIAAELDRSSGSRVAGTVGGTILLYRRNAKKPVLTLPSTRGEES
jgi:RNA-binding protein